MSFDGRVTRLERTLGVSQSDWEPTYALVVCDQDAAPTDPERLERWRARVIQTLPPGVETVFWCPDNGRDPTGPHILVGGHGREETRPLPDLSGDEW